MKTLKSKKLISTILCILAGLIGIVLALTGSNVSDIIRIIAEVSGTVTVLSGFMYHVFTQGKIDLAELTNTFNTTEQTVRDIAGIINSSTTDTTQAAIQTQQVTSGLPDSNTAPDSASALIPEAPNVQ